MARARLLKPGFFANDRLAECEPLARLLFQGLWCVADREGRLHDRPKRLKAEILPYDDCDVAALVAQLEERGFVTRYTVDGQSYIEIVNFAKHQKPHHLEAQSEIPPPPEVKSISTRSQAEVKLSSRALTLNPSPLTLNPSSSPKKPRAGRAVLDASQAKIWEEWYAIFPRHVAPDAGQRAFLKALARASPAELLAGAARYRDACKGKEPQYIAHPATWLNDGRWKDENGSTGLSVVNGGVAGLSEPRRPRSPPPKFDEPGLENRRDAG